MDSKLFLGQIARLYNWRKHHEIGIELCSYLRIWGPRDKFSLVHCLHCSDLVKIRSLGGSENFFEREFKKDLRLLAQADNDMKIKKILIRYSVCLDQNLIVACTFTRWGYTKVSFVSSPFSFLTIHLNKPISVKLKSWMIKSPLSKIYENTHKNIASNMNYRLEVHEKLPWIFRIECLPPLPWDHTTWFGVDLQHGKVGEHHFPLFGDKCSSIGRSGEETTWSSPNDGGGNHWVRNLVKNVNELKRWQQSGTSWQWNTPMLRIHS